MRKVSIIGAGAWGLACALACARAGMAVQVFEAEAIGSGSSGGVMGALAPHTPDQWEPKKQMQLESLRDGAVFWAGVDDLSGVVSGYGRTGRLVPLGTPRARELALMRVENAGRLWHGKFDWQVVDSHPLIMPDFTPYGVIYETLAARIFPAKAVASLAGACRVLGVEILENMPVTRLGDHTIAGDWGDARADAVILAGGARGFALLDQHAAQETGCGIKGQAGLLACDLGDAPQIYADGVYVIPHADGQVAIGSTTEKQFTDPTATDGQLDDLFIRARSVCPAIADAPVIQRWAGLRPKARRRDPMLGPVPGLPGVFAAMGAFKIGLGLAPVIGGMLAKMVAGEAVDLPKSFTFAHHME